MGPTPINRYSFFFFNTQLTEDNIKKKKKTEQPTQEKKKKKPKPTPKKKKKVKTWSKVVAVASLCVFNYNIVIEF